MARRSCSCGFGRDRGAGNPPLGFNAVCPDSEIEEMQAMTDEAPPNRPLEEMVYYL